MPEIDLEALIAKAEEVQDDRVVLTRNWTGKYRVYLYDYNQPNDGYNLTYDECIKQIREWGLLPKPKTLTVTLPTEHCEAIIASVNANGCCYVASTSPICVEIASALAPYQQPE